MEKAFGHLNLYTFDKVIEEGQAISSQFDSKMGRSEPEPEDVFLLCYTSGTTGDPKGVKVTQKMAALGN